MTADHVINFDPDNLPALHNIHPPPTHPDRDPTRSTQLTWHHAYLKVLVWLGTPDGVEWVEVVQPSKTVGVHNNGKAPTTAGQSDGDVVLECFR